MTWTYHTGRELQISNALETQIINCLPLPLAEVLEYEFVVDVYKNTLNIYDVVDTDEFSFGVDFCLGDPNIVISVVEWFTGYMHNRWDRVISFQSWQYEHESL